MDDSEISEVSLTGSASKQRKKLPIGARSQFDLLFKEMEILGPFRSDWKNYGPLSKKPNIPKNAYHCHVKKGKPTYVVCWRIVSKIKKTIEVFYVGTHENAPY